MSTENTKEEQIRNILCVIVVVAFFFYLIVHFLVAEFKVPYKTGPFDAESFEGQLPAASDSFVPLNENFWVEVYNGAAKDAPVLALKDLEDQKIWALLLDTRDDAIEEEDALIYLRSVELFKVLERPFGYFIYGRSKWGYDQETVVFHLDRDGNFIEFYTSY